MRTKAWILKEAQAKGSIRTAEVVKRLAISRQTAAQHFRELIAAKKLVRINSTRNARYVLYRPGRVTTGKGCKEFSASYRLDGLDEDRVLQEVVLKMGLRKLLSPAAYSIVGYAFTEMLNNAIDHSRASDTQVHLKCESGLFEFQVIDRGIGAFESVRRKFGLKDHFESVEHLSKGKQTTDPKRHSGQGIFFTSRIADRFILESAHLRLIVDNVVDDIILEDVKALKGTKVLFSIKQKSRKELKKLFDSYSNRDFEFDKTKIAMYLSERPSEYISRSQARRLLFGLEKFKRIVLDFKKVRGLGQGFSDEVFRVFQDAHPDIRIEAIHMSASVEFMIQRSLKG